MFSGPNSLPLSPLSPMYRKAVVLKADDLKGNSTGMWQRYINLIQSKGACSGLGLICETFIGNNKDCRKFLASIDLYRFKIWLHGWDHYLGRDFNEFSGSGLAHQVKHLRLSIEAGWQILGIDFYTFGAPGNAIDSNTPIALQQFPQIKVWLFGAEGHGLFVLHHVLSIEENVGVLFDLYEFIDRYENVSHQDVLTLQLHPNAWDDNGFQKF